MLIATVGLGIESAHVVGYAGTELKTGFKAVGSQFAPVSGQTIDLTTVTVTGYDKEEGTEEDVSVQTLDEYGSMIKTYFWYDIVDGEDVYYGWLDGESGEFIEAGEVTLSPGDGLWVSAPSSSFSLQTSGQVPTASTEVTLKAGFKLVANQTPVATDLLNVIVSGYDVEEGTEEDVSVQTLDEYGSMIKTYFWYDIVDGEDVYYGWLDGESGEFIEEENVMLGAGEALWVSAPSTDYKLNIAGVTL